MTASADKMSNKNPFKIKTNPRVESRLRVNVKTNIGSSNSDKSKVSAEVEILLQNHPSQMKSNTTPTFQLTKTDNQVPTAAHMNLDELNISRNHYKVDKISTETTTPSHKIKNTPGLSKIHQDDKFTTDGSLKISLMKNNPRLKLSNEDEKFSADEETLKTSNRESKVDKPSGNDPIPATEMKIQAKNNSRSNLQEKFDSKRGEVKPETDVEESSNYLDNIKARQILNRLETDDNRCLLTSADKSILSDDFVCLQVICKQINQIQSGSVRETTVQTSKFKTKSLNNNDKSKANKRSMNPDIKTLVLLQQSYTEISSSSDEEERKEYRIARSMVHLRPG